MQKLLLTCDKCGQRMQVPRSAIGRTGLCPSCGAHLQITPKNTSAAQSGKQRNWSFGQGEPWVGRGGAQPTEEAKQRFGQAVDMYYAGRYGEALAVFDSLAREFPNNQDIETAREECLRSLRRGPRPALEDQFKQKRLDEAELEPGTVRRIILEKLLHGESGQAQLQAADLACKILGMYEPGDTAQRASSTEVERASKGEPRDDAATAAAERGNGAMDGSFDAGEGEQAEPQAEEAEPWQGTDEPASH